MKTKVFLCAIILIIAVLICGCTTTSQQTTVAAAPETPSLVGNWTGTMVGYEYGVGYTNFSGYTITMSVTEQKDRVFSGEFIFMNESGFQVWENAPCAGVIGRDGKTLTMIEDGGGYSTVSIVAPDEIEIIYADGSDPFQIAVNSLKKS
jgi:hypothetical protein